MKIEKLIVLSTLFFAGAAHGETLRERARAYLQAHAQPQADGTQVAPLPAGGVAVGVPGFGAAATPAGGQAIFTNDAILAQGPDGQKLFAAPGVFATDKGVLWCPPGPTCLLYNEDGAIQVPRP